MEQASSGLLGFLPLFPHSLVPFLSFYYLFLSLNVNEMVSSTLPQLNTQRGWFDVLDDCFRQGSFRLRQLVRFSLPCSYTLLLVSWLTEHNILLLHGIHMDSLVLPWGCCFLTASSHRPLQILWVILFFSFGVLKLKEILFEGCELEETLGALWLSRGTLCLSGSCSRQFEISRLVGIRRTMR